jgi:hypothetical protein
LSAAAPHIARALRALADALDADPAVLATLCGALGAFMPHPSAPTDQRVSEGPGVFDKRAKAAERQRQYAARKRQLTSASVSASQQADGQRQQASADVRLTSASEETAEKHVSADVSVASASSRTRSLFSGYDQVNTEIQKRVERETREADASALTSASVSVSKRQRDVSKPRKRAATHVPTHPDGDAEFVARWGLVGEVADLARFADYWRSKGEAKADWAATWRNWQRQAAQYEQQRAPTKPAWAARKDALSVVQTSPKNQEDYGVPC